MPTDTEIKEQARLYAESKEIFGRLKIFITLALPLGALLY